MKALIEFTEAPKISKAVTELLKAIVTHTEEHMRGKPCTIDIMMLVMHQTLVQTIGLMCSEFTKMNIAVTKDQANKKHGGR